MYSFINLDEIIYDFGIGRDISKSLSLASNNMFCDLYIASITVSNVRDDATSEIMIYVKFTFDKVSASGYVSVPIENITINARNNGNKFLVCPFIFLFVYLNMFMSYDILAFSKDKYFFIIYLPILRRLALMIHLP